MRLVFCKNLHLLLMFVFLVCLRPDSPSPRHPPPPPRALLLPRTSQGNKGGGGVFFLLAWNLPARGGRFFQPGAQQGLDAVETVRRLLSQAQGLAVAKASQEHLGGYVAKGSVRPALGLNEGEDQQQPHPRGEGRLLGLLEQALALEQGQGFLIAGVFPFVMLFQGELALGVPEPAQSVQAVLQQPGVGVALVPADGTQALRKLRRVLGLKRQDLQTKTAKGE